MRGNVDTELVLYSAAIEYDNYDKAIVTTSDGDFACLFKFLTERGKLGAWLERHISDYRAQTKAVFQEFKHELHAECQSILAA